MSTGWGHIVLWGGVYLAAIVVLTLLAAGSVFLTTRFWWRRLVTRTGRLTYLRSVAVGVAIGLTSHYVLGSLLTVLGSSGLVVGHVLGMAHLEWVGVADAVGTVVAWTFVMAVGIVWVTLGIPLVLPILVSVWLTRRSQRDTSEAPSAPEA